MRDTNRGIIGFVIWAACCIAYDIVSNAPDSVKSFASGEWIT